MSQNILFLSDDKDLFLNMKNQLQYTGVNLYYTIDKIKPKIIIVDEDKLKSGFYHEVISNDVKLIVICNKFLDEGLLDYNIIYYVIKPINSLMFSKRILEILDVSNTSEEEILLKNKKIISELLWDIGISPNLKGYNYMREAIAIVANDFNKIKGITKFLYPQIADIYKTKPANVERSIRNAIEVGWNKGRIESIDKIFGNTVELEKGKPTNSEFIAMLADYLRLKNNKNVS